MFRSLQNLSGSDYRCQQCIAYKFCENLQASCPAVQYIMEKSKVQIEIDIQNRKWQLCFPTVDLDGIEGHWGKQGNKGKSPEGNTFNSSSSWGRLYTIWAYNSQRTCAQLQCSGPAGSLGYGWGAHETLFESIAWVRDLLFEKYKVPA